MSRSWWLQAVLYTLLVGGALIVLLPTLLPDDDQPELIRRHGHNRIQLGLDLSGGVRLVYEIDMERAISLQVDSVARALATLLQNKYSGIKVARNGNADIVVSSAPGSKLAYRHLMEAGGGWLTEVDRNDRGVRLRFDPGKTGELREISIRAAMEII